MRYGSVCSGIEAATAAWRSLGWVPSFFSEIDAFPRAVLAHHYPEVPLHGDFTTIQRGAYADIDVLVGGTPCQSFSVAGLRKGLADPRGNLMLGFGALAQRLRPKWLVWENVPGVLSSNGGRDFGSFLGMLAELGYGFAYRVLDAQYFGVAQRRRRVFVVGHAGDWRLAAAVFFERHSLSGNPAPSRETGEAVAPTIAGCANGGGANGPGRDVDSVESLVCMSSGQANAEIRLNRAPLVPAVAPTMDQRAGRSGANTFATSGGLVPVHAFDASQSNVIQYGDKTGPLDTNGLTMAVSFDTTQITSPANYSNPKSGDPCHPLAAGAHPPAIATAMQVRRLTPRECERLQGFPDDYTAIPYRGKPADQCPDGPRYKALGNSMAVPVMRWIGQRITAVEQIRESQPQAMVGS